MNKKFIQNEKLLIESLPENYLPRHQIIQQFNAAEDKRIIFLQAPGGFGKTSSTIHWTNQQKHQVLWVSLDEYDNLPTLFYKLCCNALLSAQPDNQALAAIVNDLDFPTSPVEFAILALAAFEPEEFPYTLVLDDFHFITNPKILKSLPFVLKRFSLSTKIILLSRAALPMELEEHYSENKIVKITATQLAFTKEEIFSFYKLLGKKTSSQEVALIHEQTKGWPIAIQSIAVMGQTSAPFNQKNQLACYIERQIWQKWPERTRDFLLKIATLNEVTIELAELLTGESQSKALLAEISGDSVMIHQTDENSYRFHQLFQEFLLTKLKTVTHFSVNDLYRQITLYHLEKGDIFMARNAAIDSQDEELMVLTLMNETQYMNYKTSIEEYLDTILKFQALNLPATIYPRVPVFHIIPAWYYFLTGQASKMTIHLDQLLLHFERISLESPSFIEEVVLILGLDPRQTLLTKIAAIAAVINLPERAASLPDTQLAAEKSKSKAISLSLQLPFLHRSLLDYSELSDETVFAAVRPHFEVLLQDQAEVTLAAVYAGLQLERNNLTLAGQYIYQAYAKLDDAATPELYFSLSMHLLHLHYVADETPYFQTLKIELKHWLKETNNYHLYPNFSAFTSRLAIWDGKQEQAKKWLNSYYVTTVHQIEVYKLYQHFTTIRAHILLDNYHEALLLTQKVLSHAEIFKRPADEIEATVMLVIIYWRLGNQKQAIKLLEHALEKAIPVHFIRLFADEGAALLPVLKKLKNHLNQLVTTPPEFQQFLSEVIVATSHVAQKRAGILPPMPSETVRLSKQQLRMIELLAAGHKFNEIVDITNLSINTIRAHVNLAYQKLGINNGTEAVLKAKELQLIPPNP